MKFLLVLLACSAAFITACKEDYDCEDGCCLGVGRLKKCFKYLKEHEKCTIRHKMGARCICRQGLSCVKTGVFTRRCKAVGNQDANLQSCKADNECKNGCCLGLGKLKFCKDYTKEGETCTISSSIGCGCAPGLTCMKVGLITRKCVWTGKPTPTTAPSCGKPAIQGIRIVAGKTAVRGSWPWHVLVSYDGQPTCSGTLISPEWIITAAQCVDGRRREKFTVTVGEHDRSRKEGSEVTRKVRLLLAHPRFNSYSMDYDIALVKLSQPVKFNKYVSPACLPSTDPPVGSHCYLTGWGKTNPSGMSAKVLQQGSMPVQYNYVCDWLNKETIRIGVTPRMICAGDQGKTKLSGCKGDVGGPFVCNINGRWEVHGAASHYSRECRSSRAYTVFSRINYFKEWIFEHTGRQ